MRLKKHFAPLVPLLAFAVPAPCHAVPAPVAVTVNHTNSIDLSAFNAAPKSLSATKDLSASIQGVEQSQCAPYGRQSGATAAATFSELAHTDTEEKFSAHTTAYAQGGHYRTFDYSNGPICIGIHGNDTRGSATATVTTVAEITFNPTYQHPRDYSLNISTTSDGAQPNIVITDGSGKVLYQGAQVTKTMNLPGAPGAVYFVNMMQRVAATNLGGCCNDSATSTATVDVSLEPAPILAADSLEGFIAGGNQTTSYKNVGAIVIDGAMHCTGTLIAPRTVLTAAHCLQGFEDKVPKMYFILGSNYKSPEFSTPDAVVAMIYPKGGPDDQGFSFNPQTYEDDIGLIHLKDPLQVRPSPLFAGTPVWQHIVTDKVSLDFVGFGYNVVGNEQVGMGIKREGAWEISVLENKRFGFVAQNGKNTCHGDSGGPAFYEGHAALLLAGVTSVGDQACTVGYETKVDAYATWILKYR